KQVVVYICKHFRSYGSNLSNILKENNESFSLVFDQNFFLHILLNGATYIEGSCAEQLASSCGHRHSADALLPVHFNPLTDRIQAYSGHLRNASGLFSTTDVLPLRRVQVIPRRWSWPTGTFSFSEIILLNGATYIEGSCAEQLASSCGHRHSADALLPVHFNPLTDRIQAYSGHLRNASGLFSTTDVLPLRRVQVIPRRWSWPTGTFSFSEIVKIN
ncbi:hypothetical protein M5D96_008973, partial [Drosophila gunungcola]